MHILTAQKLVNEFKKENKSSEKHVFEDQASGRSYMITIEVLQPGRAIYETRSTLNPSGAVCSCCNGSGRA